VSAVRFRAQTQRLKALIRPSFGGNLVRLGSSYGGWIIPEGVVGPDSVCYCAGVGKDITFDLAVIERYGCEVWAIDPTPAARDHAREAAVDEPRLHFLPFGVTGTDELLTFYAHPKAGYDSYSAAGLYRDTGSFTADGRTLSSLTAKLGHSDIDLLKLDIEGSEWSVLTALLRSALRPKIICVEFHTSASRSIQDIAHMVGQMVSHGYRVLSIEGFNVTLMRYPPVVAAVADDAPASAGAGER
jgi:FkbM family methyltransferase